LRSAIRVRPDYAEAYYTLGSVLKQMNQLPDAAAALREAIRLQPDFVGAHTNLAAVLRQMGDTSGANSESRLATELSKQKTNLQSATFATNSGKRLLSAGDLDGAISQFRNAVRLAPDYPDAHQQLGIALARKGDTAESQQELSKAAELEGHSKTRRQ
jgi:Flp pilus assembly protein TadD